MNLYNEKYYIDSDNYARNPRRLRSLVRAILKHNPKKVLDVGCGQGYLVRTLRELNLNAIGIDFSDSAGKLIPDWFIKQDATEPYLFDNQEFDVVISTDFFEHLKEEDIDKAYQEMQRVGKNILAIVCFKKEKIANTHQTVKSRVWWKEKLPNCEILN